MRISHANGSILIALLSVTAIAAPAATTAPVSGL